MQRAVEIHNDGRGRAEHAAGPRPPRVAGTRVSLVLMSTVVGMAIGGWMSGVIFDWTGSYQAAFLNGIAWNLVNMAIALWLLLRGSRDRARLATQNA